MSNEPIYGWTDAYVAWTEVQRASVRALSDRFRANSETAWDEAEAAIAGKETEMAHAMSFVMAQVEASHGATDCAFFTGANLLGHFARKYAARTAEAMFKQSGVSGCRTYRAIFTGRLSELMFPTRDLSNPNEVQDLLKPIFEEHNQEEQQDEDGFEDFSKEESDSEKETATGHNCSLGDSYEVLSNRFAADIHVIDVTGDDDPTPWESVYVLLSADNFTVNAMFSVSSSGVDAFLSEEKSHRCDHLRLLDATDVYNTSAIQLLRNRAFLSKTETRLIDMAEETGDYRRLAYLRVAKKFSEHFNETNHYEVYNMFGNYSFEHIERREHILLASSLDLPVPFTVYSQGGPATAAYLTAYAICGTDSKSQMARMAMLSWADAHVPGRVPIPKMATVSFAMQNGWASFLRNKLSTASHSSSDVTSAETAAKFVSTMGQFGSFMEQVVGYETYTVKFPSVYGMFPLSYVSVNDAVLFSSKMQVLCNSIRERVMGNVNVESLTTEQLESAISNVKELIRRVRLASDQDSSDERSAIVVPLDMTISSQEELAEVIQKTLDKYPTHAGDTSLVALLDGDGKVVGAQNVKTGERIDDPHVIATLQKMATAAVVELKNMPDPEKTSVRVAETNSSNVTVSVIPNPEPTEERQVFGSHKGEIKLTPMSQKQRQKFSSLRN